ncbi:uncharacterized protein [Miscanthus floridulus]|uniref:uncharacterized protein n=1 Tax=Miscanthus floridulus TaxID=154761 RepID=UPI00345AB170
MVIKTNMAGWAVIRILVNTGSSTDILFASTFDNMKLDRNLLQPAGHPLYGFRGKQVKAIGKITLPVTFGDQSNSRIDHITFNVVDMLYNYNAIFSRGVTNIFSVVLHPSYLCMKLPSARGVIAVYNNQDLARIAEEIATPGQKNVHNLGKEKPKVKIPSPNKPEQQVRVKPADETKKVPLFEGNTSKQVIISAMLDGKTEAELIHFLRDNNNIFAWSVEDLRGVDRSIIEHILDVDKNHPPDQAKASQNV